MMKSHELFLPVIKLICNCAWPGHMSDWRFQTWLIPTPQCLLMSLHVSSYIFMSFHVPQVFTCLIMSFFVSPCLISLHVLIFVSSCSYFCLFMSPHVSSCLLLSFHLFLCLFMSPHVFSCPMTLNVSSSLCLFMSFYVFSCCYVC